MKSKFQAFNYSVIPHNAAGNKKTVDVYIDGQIIDAENQEVYRAFYGDTTSVSYKSFREQLFSADAQVYNIYINSGGGLVTDAMAMHDLIQDLRSRGKIVNVEGRGIIASAATFILMASDSPRMSSNSWLMIHNVSGFAYGTVDEVEAQAKVMRQFNNRVSKFYQEKTGLSEKVINEMMNAETWMTAEDAHAKGFIAEITGEATITNTIRKENWFFNNTAVLNAYNQQVSAPPTHNNSIQQLQDEMKKFWQEFKAGFMNAITPAQENNTPAATSGESTATAVSNNAAMATAIANTFDAFEGRFEEETNTLVTNKFNDMVNSLKDNATFTALVNSAVEAGIAAKNLATTQQVEQVSNTVATLEVQNKGKATSITNDVAEAGGRKPFGRWVK